MNFDRYHIVYEERILEHRCRVCAKNSMEISFNPPANTRRILIRIFRVNVKFQFPRGKYYIEEKSKLSNCRNSKRKLRNSPPLDRRMSKRNTFPTVYEIGQPWPLVITSHRTGNHIFEAGHFEICCN